MVGFGPELSKENILKRITTEDIFKKYCPGFKNIGEKFKNRQEANPSTVIDYYNGDLLFKDFGEIGSYRAIDYVSKVFNTNFIGALKIINRDFNLGLGEGDYGTPINQRAVTFLKALQNKQKSSSPTEILIKRRDFELYDLGYWGQYYWTKEMLLSADITPISFFWVNNYKKNKFTQSKAEQFSYSLNYYWNKEVFRRKIYQPKNKVLKFISNVDFTIVQGYKRLNKQGEILFITSSLKDCGPFWRLGYNAIAPNSETSFLPENYINKLKTRFKQIFIWFDNDWEKPQNEGIINAKRFSEIYNIKYLHNPDNTPKDPSDFSKKYSLNVFNEYLKKQIN